ncbi:MAG TPA: maleylpyruvate isomerase family mycothiol-dependent enzyme, partial [Aquihabitans sp.]|nr:maleylpyruvate isomerase family mycothiol-dependent enzyme [Aquihabitans sp.]
MPTTVDRDATIAVLRRTWAAIDDLYDGLTEADHDRPTCLPGWTVKDQLSHVTSTEETLLGLPTPQVDVSGVPHLRNDIARMNEAWVEDKRSWSGAEVLARFRAVTAERLAVLDAMDQAAFDAPSWTPAGPDETYGRFMRIRHFDSYHHELDAR